MAFYAKDISNLLAGELIGENKKIDKVATLDEAEEKDICFIERYSDKLLSSCSAGVILLDKITFTKIKEDLLEGRTFIVVNYSPKLAFAKLLSLFSQRREFFGIHPTCIKGEEVLIEEGVSIGPNVVIGDRVKLRRGTLIYPFVHIEEDVEIGENSVIYSFVFLSRGTKIGNRVIIHPGAKIGQDGFGYVQNNNNIEKIPQLGGVIIEDDVEIGANTTIDRATVGNTIIKKGTKIDNLVQIAHNVKIGKNCIIVSQTGIAGSVILEDNVILGGQVGVKEHIIIGEGTKVGAKSGVTKNIPKNQVYSGFPAKPHRKELSIQAALSKLAKNYKKIK